MGDRVDELAPVELCFRYTNDDSQTPDALYTTALDIMTPLVHHISNADPSRNPPKR